LHLVTHLRDANYFAIGTPSCLLQKLRYLGCLPRTSLTHYNGCWVRLNQIE
jgi:hypothetical protein